MEFRRVLFRSPVKPRQPVQRAILQTAQPPAPISLHIIGEDRVREQGHMAKDIMEHVRFLQIVKLVGTADEIARYESPIGEMVEKHFVGNQAWHRHHSRSEEHTYEFQSLMRISYAVFS